MSGEYRIMQTNDHKYQVAESSPVIVLNVSHDGDTQTDFVLPLFIHRGFNIGDITGRDAYMNNLCKADFSDIIFTDNDDNVLDSYLHSHGNYEFIETKYRGGVVNLIDAEGNIYTSRLDNGDAWSYQKLYKSSDNGVTWMELYGTGDGTLIPLYIDSRGYIFCRNGATYRLLRSTDGGINFSEVFDMSDVSGYINVFGIDEAPDGSLYFGRYQEALNSAKIFKSSDDGANWVEVFFDATQQHIHGLQIDQITGYVYAGIDATFPFPIVRSIDGGENWTEIYTGAGGNATGIICGDGFRVFAAETTRGYSIIRTTDDINFINVLQTDYTISSLRYIDGACYATGKVFNRNYYPALFRSIDDGLTWETIWIHNFDRSGVGAGYGNSWPDFDIPADDDSNMVMQMGGPDSDEYPPARLYHGNKHYQALFYVKFPSLPATGVILKIKTEKTTVSDKAVFDYIPTDNLLLRYKLNEGSGLDVFDSSGNGRHGTIRPEGIGSWNGAAIKRAGSLYPPVIQDGASYNFDATEYADASAITVTGSETDGDLQMIKDFSVVAWVKDDDQVNGTIIGKGRYATLAWAFGRTGVVGTLTFTISDGSTRTEIYSTNAPYHPNGAKNYPFIGNDLVHMVGFVIDNEATPNIRFFIDGNLLLPLALPYNIIANSWPIVIGAEAANYARYITMDLDDILIYDRQLTELEFRGIYEGRLLLNDEPVIFNNH